MAKYYGEIGFSITEEIRPGVWKNDIHTRNYAGDLIKASYNWQNSSYVNDNLNISNRISLISDRFMEENMGSMKYATYANQKWKITSVEVEYPRLIISLGGLWHDES